MCDTDNLSVVSIWRAFVIVCSTVLSGTGMADGPDRGNESGKDKSMTLANAAFNNWEESGWPLLETFCLDCHNADYQEAEIDLTLLSTMEGVRDNGDLANHVVSLIRFGAMPPEDADLPTLEQRRDLADRLDDLVFHGTCDLRPRPGRTTARRLNRAEYNNAIRDLFGVDWKVAEQFPSDEVGGGFDNNADVLSLSPMLMEKYLQAAESIVNRLIVDPETLPSVDKTFADSTLHIHGESQSGRFGQRYVTAKGLAWVELDIPVSGKYQIQVRASPSDHERGKRLTTMHSRDGRLLEVFEFKGYDDSGRDDYESIKLNLQKGKATFFFKPTDHPASDLKRLKEKEWKIGETIDATIAELDEKVLRDQVLKPGTSIEPTNRVDRERFPFRMKSVTIEGPMSYDREDLPPTQLRVLRQLASRRDGFYVKVAGPAKASLKPILRQAFRCEVSDEDVQPYVELVEKICERGGSYYQAMQTAVAAVLVSPRFLFRVELPETQADRERAIAGKPVPLSSTQIASRLSFFLWSSLPDDSLLNAAAKGQLNNADRRRYYVRRMLSDPKSDSLGSQFARQWFGLGGLSGRDFNAFAKQSKKKPVIAADTLSSETEQLFLHLLRENKPVTELLTADYTFVDSELAKWYGDDMKASADEDNGFRQFKITTQSRRGVLGHAGVLLLTSYPTRNSPVQRGKWILENVLGTPPPEAPPGVPGLEETKTADANATLREQLELHRADPGCASCHRVMDSLGFGLEEFDHYGRLRAKDDPARKDAKGELPGGRGFEGASKLSEMLAKTEPRKIAETCVRRMLAFAIGRELRPADRCFVEKILDETEESGYRVRDLLEHVIESPPFLNHQAEVPVSVASLEKAKP